MLYTQHGYTQKPMVAAASNYHWQQQWHQGLITPLSCTSTAIINGHVCSDQRRCLLMCCCFVLRLQVGDSRDMPEAELATPIKLTVRFEGLLLPGSATSATGEELTSTFKLGTTIKEVRHWVACTVGPTSHVSLLRLQLAGFVMLPDSQDERCFADYGVCASTNGSPPSVSMVATSLLADSWRPSEIRRGPLTASTTSSSSSSVCAGSPADSELPYEGPVRVSLTPLVVNVTTSDEATGRESDREVKVYVEIGERLRVAMRVAVSPATPCLSHC